MKSVLALDQGTTGSTALIVSQDGAVLGRGYREFTQHYPEAGWVEHDPEEIIESTLGAARDALHSAGQVPDAIGITNQRESVVVWDRETGEPLHRVVVWQDRRTTNRCLQLKRDHGAKFLMERTGLVWDPYFSGSKIEWLLQHVPGLRGRVDDGSAVFGTIDSWLIYRLTDGQAFVTDHTNASRTLLYNINDFGWDEELLALFDVPRESLPDIRNSSDVVGVTAKPVFGAEIPIAGIAGDQQAALFGQACWDAGNAKCTFGTGAFLLENVGLNRGAAEESAVLTTVACDSNGAPAYALEGSVFIAGAAIQWLRDEVGILTTASESENLAAGLPENGGVYFVPAFVGLGAPFWEPNARGALFGVTRGTTRAHIVRAALESMAYSVRDVAEAMETKAGVKLGELRVDGGAAANDWLMQYQADLLGTRVGRPDLVETTALGAAGLAGLAAGVWKSPAEFAESRTYSWFEPGEPREREYSQWCRAIGATLHWSHGGDA